jgi:hypothetical protein
MKNSLLNNPLFVKTIVLITCFMLVMIYNKSKAQSLPTKAVEEKICK